MDSPLTTAVCRQPPSRQFLPSAAVAGRGIHICISIGYRQTSSVHVLLGRQFLAKSLQRVRSGSRPDRKFGRFDILTTCLRKHCQCCHFLETSVLIKLPRRWCFRFVAYFVLPKNTIKSHFEAVWLPENSLNGSLCKGRWWMQTLVCHT